MALRLIGVMNIIGDAKMNKTTEFEVISTDDTWKQYGLSEKKVRLFGSEDYKAIIKDKKLVMMTGKDYALLPNEELVKAADSAALELGAVPFDKFTGKWFHKTDKHVFYTKSDRQVHALFTFNDPIEIGKGDTVHLGFAAHNSIDGSLGMAIGAFTFRNACSNMVFMGYRNNKMAFDDRSTIAYVYNKHTKNLSINLNSLKFNIKNVVSQARMILDQYKLWVTEELKEEVAKTLVKKLSKKYLPGYIKVDKKTKKVEITEKHSMWETYNDLTQQIWHNQKTDYQTKKYYFDQVHKSMMPLVTVKVPVKRR